jgi:hypothetical protein
MRMISKVNKNNITTDDPCGLVISTLATESWGTGFESRPGQNEECPFSNCSESWMLHVYVYVALYIYIYIYVWSGWYPLHRIT